jgi:5-deoxy-glucuronate isomerase
MLSDTRFRVPRAQGIQLLQGRGDAGARELTTRRLTLAAGTSTRFVAPDEETVLVVQSGEGTLRAGGSEWVVRRQDVFDDRPTAIWVPPAVELEVEAITAFEAVLVSTPAEAGGSPAMCGPDDVKVMQRGRDLYTREVREIFVRDPHVKRLMVGETINARGQWSSYPPHKHDGRDGEPRLEEAYYFRVDPPRGFGIQMLYTADGESAVHEVRDGDLVLLPYGYHPVSAPPGYRVYYLWAIVGDQRQLAVYEDPAHSWVHEVKES